MTLRVRRSIAQFVVAACLLAAPAGLLAAHAETVTPVPPPSAVSPAATASVAPSDSVTPFIDTAPEVAPDNSHTLYALIGAGLLALGAALFTFFKR